MCLIQKVIFRLKEGFTVPHTVKVSFNNSGTYAKVVVGDSFKQKIEFFPCSRGEAGCSMCPELFFNKPDSIEKIFVRMMKYEEIFVEEQKRKEVGTVC